MKGVRYLLFKENGKIIYLSETREKFKQGDINLDMFYEHISHNFTFDAFKMLSAECWKEKYYFLTIVKNFDLSNGRYRMGHIKF